MERQIWVDFNEQDDKGRALTLCRFVEPGVDLSLGARILAGDHEGNLCWANIANVTANGVITLALDGETFTVSEPRERVAV
jgi:hypothetical protein